MGLSAGDGGHGFDDVRRPDGAGDRRVAAQPGRAADGPARGERPWPPIPVFIAALKAVGQDARRASLQSDIYYLWSLERVCVALGLRSLDGFDWYAHGARILIDRQQDDGGWPHDRWGRLPGTSLALLFLRKANLAFEIDRVLRLPGAASDPRVIAASATGSREPERSRCRRVGRQVSGATGRRRGGRGRGGRREGRRDRCQRTIVPTDLGSVRGEAARRLVSARRGARRLSRDRGGTRRRRRRLSGTAHDRGDSDDRRPGGRPQPEHGGRKPDRRLETGGPLVPREAARRVRESP